MNRSDRIQGCLLGLAVGDALGGPAEGKRIEELQKRHGRILDFLSDDQAGSDDTEYALFNAQLLLKYGDKLTSDIIADEWLHNIASDRREFKGAGFSEVLTIANLRSGIRPPQSGMHLHSWSDGLAMRVAPFGIYYSGFPEKAAQFAEIDGVVSHAGEGILAGKFVAAALSLAVGGFALSTAIEEALRMVPTDSWTFRAIAEGIEIGRRAHGVWEAIPALYNSLACTHYPWADLAPEAVGIAAGLVTAWPGRFSDAVLAAVNVGRDADTIAAIVGAFAGSAEGLNGMPHQWIERVRQVKGVCITSMADVDIIDISLKLTAAEARRP
jgi:ADP-ribosylglycohydrolase